MANTDSGGTKGLVANSGNLSPGVWVFVAAVFDGEEMILYKDGGEVGRTNKTGTLTAGVGVREFGVSTQGLVGGARAVISRKTCITPLIALAFWIRGVAVVWAQDAAAAADGAANSRGGMAWMLSYGIVALAIALGVYVVCRPVRRSEVDD